MTRHVTLGTKGSPKATSAFHIDQRGQAGPLYQKISRELARRIQESVLPVGLRMPTELELARQLGTSPATVAKAYRELSDRGLIERKQKQGTFVRRSRPRVGKIIFLAPDIHSVYMTSIIAGMNDVLAGSRDIVIRTAENSPDPSMFEKIHPEDADGIVTMWSRAYNTLYQETIARGLIVVTLQGYNPMIPFVSSDNVMVGRLAARHLIEQGHRDIGLVYPNFESGRERRHGFELELARAGLVLPEAKVYYAGRFHRNCLLPEELAVFFDSKVRPKAVLAYNDGLALQLYHEAGRRGLKVPEDLALVGVDNYCWDYHGVELTSVDLNLREVGRQAAILFTRIADENLVFEPGRPVGVEVEPTLAVRTSSIGR